MTPEPKFQKNMFLPIATMERIRALKKEYKEEYKSETAVIIAAVDLLANTKLHGVLA